MNNSEFSIITFYQFKKINNLKKIEKLLKDLCFFHKIRGTVLIAEEGINGTLAGFAKSVDIIEKKLVDLDKNQSQITFLRLDERNWMFCFYGIFFK